MLTKTQLRCYNSHNPPKQTLERSKETQDKYEEFMKNPQNSKTFIKIVKQKLRNKSYHLVNNDFPYCVEDKIKHMVCWYKIYSEDIMKEISKKYKVITFWENLSENKSVTEVNHIHIFICE